MYEQVGEQDRGSVLYRCRAGASSGRRGHGHRRKKHIPKGLHPVHGLLPQSQKGVDIPHRYGGDREAGRQGHCVHGITSRGVF